jgi:hypothetical protein
MQANLDVLMHYFSTEQALTVFVCHAAAASSFLMPDTRQSVQARGRLAASTSFSRWRLAQCSLCAVASIEFFPLVRGGSVYPFLRFSDYSLADQEACIRPNNDETLLVPIVEHQHVLKHIEGIRALDDAKDIAFGAGDLSFAMGSRASVPLRTPFWRRSGWRLGFNGQVAVGS